MSKKRAEIPYPMQRKLLTLVLTALVPLLIITSYLIYSLLVYSRAYEEIADNMTVANQYNIFFREDMNESLYKLVVGYVTFDNIDEDETLKNPEDMLRDLRHDFEGLADDTEGDSRLWLQSLLRNLDTLEGKVSDIKRNLDEGGQYDENMTILDNDIYSLTDLIQEDIQYFIYYQTRDIESLRQELHQRVYAFILFWGITSAAIALVVLVMAIWMVRGIVKPINELCEVTDRIAGGDFESRVSLQTDDELMTLAESVNDMSKHLEVMVDTIKEDEAKMRRAELRLLQEQINPHFLYNTLDTIVWLVESGKSNEAIDMVVSLSEFFRLVLSSGRELITIRDEERHVKSYLNIQQVRYRDILDYVISINPEIYDFSIQKMTLQPLVENSLYHGIKYKRAKGTIRIGGHRDKNNVILTVSDDGVGMDEDTLHKLREEITRKCKDTETGFGLANVSERIRMQFGPEYGMSIDSVQGVGTTVRITIPALLYEQATEDRQDEAK